MENRSNNGIVYNGWSRTEIDKRVTVAHNQAKLPAKDINKVKETVKKSLTRLDRLGISADVSVIKGLKNITEWKRKNIKDDFKKTYTLWIEFTKSGHVAVVGAGMGDIGFPNLKEDSQYATCRILKKAGKGWQGNRDIWIWPDDEEKAVIVISVTGMSCVHKTENPRSLLQCRDGLEYYVGECLIDDNIPILNMYSHRNWTKEYWDEMKKKDFVL